MIIQLDAGSFKDFGGATVLEADGGVYVSFDVDAAADEFRFYEGAVVVGYLDGTPDLITPPEPIEWFTEFSEQWE